LKASSDEQERLSITEEMVEMVASRLTEAAVPEISDKLADISDVFATPPASSEPPILPSDMNVESVSWPIIDSTLSTEEAQPQPQAEPEIRKKKEAHILYELVSDDGFYAQSNSLSTVWKKLLDAVQDARLAFKMEPLYNGCLKSVEDRNLHLTGLHHHAIINLLEQLPNADCFPDYTFRYRAHRDRESAEKLITGSMFGCVRAAPFNGRVPYDMFGWLASQYRPRPQLSVRSAVDPEAPGRRVTNFELLPMTVRFKHLRQVAKNSVGVYRSHIHGRGLFCKRDIEVGKKKFILPLHFNLTCLLGFTVW
jgi:histone-lysine N-methyltransferase MLL1